MTTPKDKKDNEPNMGVFDTHKFLFTLNYENSIDGHKVTFENRNNEIQQIELEKIEIGASPVSCKLFCKNGKRYLVPFIRIKKIYKGDELVWDNSDADTSNVNVIKGFD